MRRVAIVGGGISGLTTAYFLQEQKVGVPVDCTLIEGKNRLGGVVFSEKVGGCTIEAGPDSFFTPKPQALDLCVKLGLSVSLMGTNPAKNRVYVFCGGRLHRLPDGMYSVVPSKLRPFLTADLITPLGKARMLLDLLKRRGTGTEDESLAHFVGRRLGREVLERIAEPLMAGIYSGDAAKLSMKTNFPQLLQLEREHRSLILGTIANRSRNSTNPKTSSRRRPVFMSLRGGLVTMVDAIASHLDETSILTGSNVVALTKAAAGSDYELRTEEGKVVRADCVVLATPAYVSAGLLRDLNPEAAATLDSIPYVSAATVALVYERASFPNPLDGTGFVVSPAEGRRITACTWVSSKWPEHATPDKVVLRCYFGRDGDEEVLGNTDEELCRLAQDEVNSILGISAKPSLQRVNRSPKSMPQYNLGHAERLASLDVAMRNSPGVLLTGSAYKGVGLSDCVRQGEQAAEQVLSLLK